ncbi:MAG: molybdopterin-dependent oxidoreductase [Bryobacteraceae bacterium]
MTERRREIALPEQELQRELSRRTRRGFLIGAVAAAGAIGGYEWMRSRGEDDGVPWPERDVLNANGKISRAYASDSHLMPTYSRDEVGFLKPNGDIGMDAGPEADKWRVNVTTEGGGPALNLALSDIKALPKVEMITRFCCIEGWSAVTYWAGARFCDFTKKYFRSDMKLPNFVYMATPGEDYFVGLDMKSAMHPQTLLAYEQNGEPLKNEHGAPLRLAIPVKYGIKNIKRIGLIQYTDTKPSDYWAEEGYDWFAGL